MKPETKEAVTPSDKTILGLVGVLIDELRRQKLWRASFLGEDFEVAVKIKKPSR